MNFAFPWPYSQGEWLAWGAAAFTIFLGLVAMFAPRLALRALRLAAMEGRPDALAASRAQLGGFYIGVGASAILFAQPLIYLTLGLSWALAAFGCIVSMMSDRGNTLRNWGGLALMLALAALPLAFALGFVP
ncbi:DUF4345 domain-containing protein [Chelativorans sp. M5D2P16]|uniref:AGROH133_08824 family phage infection protein n=1 Tax=Chelativorans sp. M5D2P16 TaxID=3095678 RepID=UPI002ACA0BF0|nr:DUF4345 domain-containing protein [Chelativorans sp. M5D2P16]MDZ5699405.1 DUF4345 domain-containing protein [Chelativorans sp. M5D2P16]